MTECSRNRKFRVIASARVPPVVSVNDHEYKLGLKTVSNNRKTSDSWLEDVPLPRQLAAGAMVDNVLDPEEWKSIAEQAFRGGLKRWSRKNNAHLSGKGLFRWDVKLARCMPQGDYTGRSEVSGDDDCCDCADMRNKLEACRRELEAMRKRVAQKVDDEVHEEENLDAAGEDAGNVEDEVEADVAEEDEVEAEEDEVEAEEDALEDEKLDEEVVETELVVKSLQNKIVEMNDEREYALRKVDRANKKMDDMREDCERAQALIVAIKGALSDGDTDTAMKTIRTTLELPVYASAETPSVPTPETVPIPETVPTPETPSEPTPEPVEETPPPPDVSEVVQSVFDKQMADLPDVVQGAVDKKMEASLEAIQKLTQEAQAAVADMEAKRTPDLKDMVSKMIKESKTPDSGDMVRQKMDEAARIARESAAEVKKALKKVEEISKSTPDIKGIVNKMIKESTKSSPEFGKVVQKKVEEAAKSARKSEEEVKRMLKEMDKRKTPNLGAETKQGSWWWPFSSPTVEEEIRQEVAKVERKYAALSGVKGLSKQLEEEKNAEIADVAKRFGQDRIDKEVKRIKEKFDYLRKQDTGLTDAQLRAREKKELQKLFDLDDGDGDDDDEDQDEDDAANIKLARKIDRVNERFRMVAAKTDLDKDELEQQRKAEIQKLVDATKISKNGIPAKPANMSAAEYAKYVKQMEALKKKHPVKEKTQMAIPANVPLPGSPGASGVHAGMYMQGDVRVASLTAENTGLKESVARLTAENTGLKTSVAELTASCSLKQKIAELEARGAPDSDSTNERLLRLQMNQDDFVRRIRQDIADITGKLPAADTTDVMRRLDRCVEDCSTDKQRLNARIAELMQDTGSRDEVEKLRRQLEACNTERGKLNEQVVTLRAQALQRLEGRLAGLDSSANVADLDEFQSVKAAGDAVIADLRKQLEDLRAAKPDEAVTSDLRKQVADLQAAKAADEAVISELRKRPGPSVGVDPDLSRDLTVCRQKLEEHKIASAKQVVDFRFEIKGVKDQNAVLNAEVGALVAQIKEFEDMRATMDDLRAQLVASADCGDKLKTCTASLEAMGRRCQEVQGFVGVINTTRATIAELSETVKKVTDEKNVAVVESQNLQREVTRLSGEARELGAKVTRLEDEKRALDGKVTRLEREKGALMGDVDKNLAQCTGQLAACNAERESLIQQLYQRNSELDTCKTHRNEMQTRNATLQRQLQETQDAVSNRDNEVAVLQVEIASMGGMVERLQNENRVSNEDISKKLKDCRDAMEKAKGTGDELNVCRAELGLLVSQHETIIRDLRAQLDKKEREATNVQMEVVRLQGVERQLNVNVENLQRELDECNRIRGEMNTEGTNLQAQLNAALVEQQNLQAQLERARAEQQNLQAQLERARAEQQNLQAQLERARAEQQDLRAQLERAVAEQQDLRAQLERAVAELEACNLARANLQTQLDDAGMEQTRLQNQLQVEQTETGNVHRQLEACNETRVREQQDTETQIQNVREAAALQAADQHAAAIEAEKAESRQRIATVENENMRLQNQLQVEQTETGIVAEQAREPAQGEEQKMEMEPRQVEPEQGEEEQKFEPEQGEEEQKMETEPGQEDEERLEQRLQRELKEVKKKRYTSVCEKHIGIIENMLDGKNFPEKAALERELASIKGFCKQDTLSVPRSVANMLARIQEALEKHLPPKDNRKLHRDITRELKSIRQNLLNYKMVEPDTGREAKKRKIEGGMSLLELGEFTREGMSVSTSGDGVHISGHGVDLSMRPLPRGAYQFRSRMSGDVFELTHVRGPESFAFLREMRDKFGVHVVKRGCDEAGMTSTACRKLVGDTWVKVDMLML
jgi:chromosome segregation ATPase